MGPSFNLAGMLNMGFTWDLTSEGTEYWHEVWRALYEGGWEC